MYSFGVEARAESEPGVVALSLAQLDASGRALAPAGVITRAVGRAGDGSNCSELPGIENYALYVGGRTNVLLKKGAAKLRVTLYFSTSGIVYDVTNVFLSRL